MKKERADKSDKLDVTLSPLSSRSCSRLRRSRRTSSRDPPIPSSPYPKKQITPCITSSTSSTSSKNFRITTSPSPTPRTCLPSAIPNLWQHPRSPVFIRPARSVRKRWSLLRLRAASLTIPKSSKVSIAKAPRSQRTKSKMLYSSISP